MCLFLTFPVLLYFLLQVRVGANLEFTIGPDLTNEALTLSVVPDPIFATDGSAIVGDSEHTIGSGALLVINVSVYWSMFGCGCSD